MRLLTPIQAYELEDISMNSMGISGYKLMGNAGRCIADLAMKMISDNNVPLIVIVCGKGNNGGDGFATALELLNYNVQVQIYVTCNRGEIKDDALIFFLECESHKFSKNASRNEYLQLHRQKDRSILVNPSLLGEGYDDPKINTVLFAVLFFLVVNVTENIGSSSIFLIWLILIAMLIIYNLKHILNRD